MSLFVLLWRAIRLHASCANAGSGLTLCLQRLDAGQGFAFHPFQEGAAGGRDIGEPLRHAGGLSAATVSPPPATETSLPALVRSAA